MARQDTYTHGHQAAVVNQHARRTAEDCARFMQPIVRSDSTILDVGCGPGSITAGLSKWVPEGHVTAIEPGGDILDVARAAIDAAEASNVSVEEASVYELPYEDDSFDVAYAHQVLQHLTDPVAALIEMRRVVRPGGHIAVRDADYYTMSCYPESAAIDEWRRIYRAVARHNGAEPDAGRHLLAWCHRADLHEVNITASVWAFADAADRENWGMSWADRTLTSAFGAQAVEYEMATIEDLNEIASAWREWAVHPDGFFHFIHDEALAVVR
ncbi:MAG: SAM-dependent methyltransferase [Candidatus Poriferisodalaceae bacterium]|jgi:SAM-dependent methyltransferase